MVFNLLEFYFGHVLPKAEDIEALDLKCVPGRTVLKITEKVEEAEFGSSDDEYDGRRTNYLRSHMNTGMKDEHCQVCVCSVDGKDEYCSQRPAMNVNECMRMNSLTEEFQSNMPYDHTRILAHRIRRDYIWHNDEIPYEAKARCKRGHSYYSNSITANETDIDVASDVESLLDYSNKSVCFYCVCSTDGRTAGCINRLPWFCEYYRDLRDEDASRDRYTHLFQQDRPKYFRQLSWRLRRTMDEGMYDFMETVGVENEEGDPTKCVPFVSEYTDCTDENKCSGCNKCMCVGDNKWSCQFVAGCPGDERSVVDDESLDNALNSIQREIDHTERVKSSSGHGYAPPPSDDKDKDLLLGFDDTRYKYDDRIRMLMRTKRSAEQANLTADGVKFHHTVDELNEDTLKNGNLSGTLQAQKVNALPAPLKGSRRTGLLTTDTLSQNLQIEHNQPKAYDDQLTDNKIDAAVHSDDKINVIDDEKISSIIGNHTQKQKDKDLSKVIVNELKSGTEVIGDKNAPIMSNITFTPENDTLTAMAFIAGNLLNKLWNMEKDSREESRETEALKHEKIADLLDLFKEPLNLRQENFLKSALEQLSEAVGKDKVVNNLSWCDIVNKTKAKEEYSDEYRDIKTEKTTVTRKTNENPVKVDSVAKINNVVSLIKKFQRVQKKIHNLKKTDTLNHEHLIERPSKVPELSDDSSLTNDESESLNVFGNILEKITKLLMPPKKSKKIVKSIRNQNVLSNTDAIAKTLKNMYNIDISNSTLTAKDKIVFDYLNTVKKNPKCLLDNLKADNTKSISSIEGDILLNLSEFFKVKSFVDLIKLLDAEAQPSYHASDVTTMKNPEVSTETTTVPTTEIYEMSVTTELSDKLSNTKAKLKTHLRNIVDDLIELQNAKGQLTKNISIVDALPCIFKILNADNDGQSKQLSKKHKALSQKAKVAAIFDSLKKDLQATSNRRSNIVTEHRPKSAVVWERVIKNFDGRNKLKTRRHMEPDEPKSFDEIKKQIDYIESSSKTYKNLALTNGVPPSGRQMLLKTLLEDIRLYINVLDDINSSLETLKDISQDQMNDIREFVANAAVQINIDKKIAKDINIFKINNKNDHAIKNTKAKRTKENYIAKKSMKMIATPKPNEKDNIKLSRDAIINQLIKNRMKLYVKVKETNAKDLNSDLNYDIAKRVLDYLDKGNYNLARELYKVLITPKTSDAPNKRFKVVSTTKKPAIFMKEPLLQFEEPRSRVQWLSQEAWLKQIDNLRNMRA